jgi:nucleoid-associated protein YgaU
MANKSLWDRALDSLTTRDELAAAEQAKRVAQDALARAEFEKEARKAAEARAIEAEKKLAEAMSKAAGSSAPDMKQIINLNTEMSALRGENTTLKAEIAKITADKDHVIADLTNQIAALQTKAVEEQAATYKVKSGDSLSKIAKAVYGDWKHWKEIYEANKDTIKNPDLIRVGQELKLPKL